MFLIIWQYKSDLRKLSNKQRILTLTFYLGYIISLRNVVALVCMFNANNEIKLNIKQY